MKDYVQITKQNKNNASQQKGSFIPVGDSSWILSAFNAAD